MLGARVFRPLPTGEMPPGAGRAPLVSGCVLDDFFVAHETCDWLTPSEATRAAAMGSARRRAQFVAGRWLLHRTASEAFGAHGYAFDAPDGRPVLRALAPAAAASCSISHSANVVLCAAGKSRACGVDVEAIRPRRDFPALCARVLHPRELARVRGAPEHERWRRFYEIWVVKEAVAKALGIGLGFPFRALAVAADARLEEAPPRFGLLAPSWHVRALDAGDGVAAALAWQD